MANSLSDLTRMNTLISSRPSVTVLMTVYNGEKYLRLALESVLNQTFTDFEFLIIDDASTDSSYEIINSYNDPRIKVIRNAFNYGITRSLNLGLQKARGVYVARMDADDICMPERFEEQVKFLDSHPTVAVLGVKALLIDCMDSVVGCWKVDSETTTYEQIRQCLPKENCIAHPGVMMRKEIISRYLYNEKQLNSQDYDLWLRLIADNHVIDKLDKYLIKHRLHTASITYKSNISDVYLKEIRTFYGYLLTRNRNITVIDLKVGYSLIYKFAYWMLDICMNKTKERGKRLFLWIGQLAESMTKQPKSSSLFFVFPVYHVGGAERVHCDILELVAEKRPWIIFSDKSNSTALRGTFASNGTIVDLSRFSWNIFLKLIFLGFWSARINRTQSALVFGSNSMFFYELIPHLNGGVCCIDLIHALAGGIDILSLPFAARLNARIVVNVKTLMELTTQYRSNGLNENLIDRVLLIENKVFVPDELPEKNPEGLLRVVYVGRGTEEKRVHLIGKIARLCHERNMAVEFTLVGDVYLAIDEIDRPFCRFLGEINNQSCLREIYKNSDIILVTSSREGFPLVIMEAMAYGVIPISTDVGGINSHVHNGKNGYLVAEVGDSLTIVNTFVDILDGLSCSHDSVKRMSHDVYEYAKLNFDSLKFNAKYRNLFDNYRCMVF